MARIEDRFVVNRGDTLEATELSLERSMRYVIKGSVRSAARGLRFNLKPIDASLNGSTAST